MDSKITKLLENSKEYIKKNYKANLNIAHLSMLAAKAEKVLHDLEELEVVCKFNNQEIYQQQYKECAELFESIRVEVITNNQVENIYKGKEKNLSELNKNHNVAEKIKTDNIKLINEANFIYGTTMANCETVLNTKEEREQFVLKNVSGYAALTNKIKNNKERLERMLEGESKKQKTNKAFDYFVDKFDKCFRIKSYENLIILLNEYKNHKEVAEKPQSLVDSDLMKQVKKELGL